MSTLVENKKAFFDFELSDQYEAGIELFGLEVKALRQKHGSLEGAYVTLRGGEAFIMGLSIPPYQAANTPKDYDSARVRKLLLTKAELRELIGKEHEKGLTLIPISLYNKGRHIKLSFGIARKKKKFDKRETIKKRDTERDIAREMRDR